MKRKAPAGKMRPQVAVMLQPEAADVAAAAAADAAAASSASVTAGQKACCWCDLHSPQSAVQDSTSKMQCNTINVALCKHPRRESVIVTA